MKTFVNIEAVHEEEIDLRNEMELKIKMDGKTQLYKLELLQKLSNSLHP